MQSKTVLLASIAVILFILIYGYPIFRCLWWILEHFISKTWYFYFICIAVPLLFQVFILICTAVGFLVRSIKVRYFMYLVIDYISFDFPFLFLIIICEFIFDFSSAAHKYAWIVCISLVSLVLIYIILAHLNGVLILRKKKVNLKSSKLKQPLRIIQISDVHIGSRSTKFLNRVVKQVNILEGDIVCVTGDLVDISGVVRQNVDSDGQNPYPAMQPLANITAKCGVYLVMGNHDFVSGGKSFVKMIQHFPNVRLLQNEYIDVSLQQSAQSNQTDKQIRIVGIEDGDVYEFTGEVNNLQSSNSSLFINETSDSPYTILLHHRPHDEAWLTALNALKGDLFLAGHTHNGQIFPWHPLIYHWFSHPYGLLSVPASVVQQGSQQVSDSNNSGNGDNNSGNNNSCNNNNNGNSSNNNINNKDGGFNSFDRHMYVNPGTGSWGTPARTSGFGEITIITVFPE